MRQLLAELSVAPLAGAWVEIITYNGSSATLLVAPLAGAWVEISAALISSRLNEVAPLAGAWIEIGDGRGDAGLAGSRSPSGSVD